MKVAHLILAHSNPQQIKRLVDAISHPNDFVFIHFDLKCDLSDFKILESNPQVQFVKNRVKVKWGGYSVVEATLNSFQEIIDSNIEFDYLNLISGQDYPIKPISAFHEFLMNNSGKAFMEFYDIDTTWKEAKPRLEKYSFLEYPFLNFHFIENLINYVLPKRKLPKDFICIGRSQWFTITSMHIKYILEFQKNNRSILRFFKFSWGADEIIFQSILYNSPFKKDMVNNDLRYIDWTEKKINPKLLSMVDKDELIQSDKFFARKFNINFDAKILIFLDEKLQ